MYELRGTGLSRAQVNAGCRPNARASFGLPGSPEVIGGSKGFSSVKRRNGNNEPTCMTLTPILHPPPGSPERRAVPRRFVAFVNYVITLCAPTAATSRARFTYRCPATSARSSVPFPPSHRRRSDDGGTCPGALGACWAPRCAAVNGYGWESW